MLGMFRSKPMLTNEGSDFQLAVFSWLLKHFGGKDFYTDAVLVLPTQDFFPSKVSSDDEAAITTFNAVKKYAGLEEWPCLLKKQEEDVDVRIAPTMILQNAPHNPLGTFQATSSDNVVITYNPSIVRNPTQLVATYAHELAHYLTGSANEVPPGGWDNWEFATDIAATFLGFGIFMANSASNFQQYSGVDGQGWTHSRNGYLSIAEHIYALAIFLALKDIPVQSAIPHLKPNLKKLLKKSVSELDNSLLIKKLKLVEYQPIATTQIQVRPDELSISTSLQLSTEVHNE